jgi:hypothetical protein
VKEREKKKVTPCTLPRKKRGTQNEKVAVSRGEERVRDRAEKILGAVASNRAPPLQRATSTPRTA